MGQLYIGAYDALSRLFELIDGVYMGIGDLWQGQITLCKVNSVYNVVPKSSVTRGCFILMLRPKSLINAAYMKMR